MLELLKTVGALSGLFAAGFLVWDRYSKHFPAVTIVAQPLSPGSQNITHRLRVKNVSERPILVSWSNINPAPTQLLLAKDHSFRGIMDPLYIGPTVIALGPEQEVFLPLLSINNYGDIDPDNILTTALRWRFAQPIIWNADRTLRVTIRKRDYDDMIDNYVSTTEDQ